MCKEDITYVKRLLDTMGAQYIDKQLYQLTCMCGVAGLVSDEYGLECEHCIFREMFEHFSDMDDDYESSCEKLVYMGLS